MSSRRSKSYLKCGHYVNYEEVPPNKGDLVWCAMCRGYRIILQVEIIAVLIKDWHWRCDNHKHPRPIVKTYVDGKLACEKAAIYHAKRNHHTVTMYTPSQTVYHVYRDHDPNQTSLPVTPDDESDEYPF